MFLSNKYSKTYNSIISRAKSRSLSIDTYVEIHHIIPRSFGGSNDHDNLVRLTAKEHFICHLLLTKMVKGNHRYKMIFALNRMLTSSDYHNRYTPSARIYELTRKMRSEAISTTHKGIPETPESNLKRSKSLKGRKQPPRSKEHNKNISLSKLGKPSKNKGGTTSIKGKTYEEIYGIDRAAELKTIRSIKLKNRIFSDETKAIWSKNRKGKTTGGKNPNAKAVSIYGVEYSCKKDAMAALRLTLYELNKLLAKLNG